MAITVANPTRTAMVNAVGAQLDAGATGAILTIGTAGMAVTLAVLTAQNTFFSGVTNGVGTADTINGETNAPNSGTAAAFTLTDSNAVLVLSGSVGTSGEDINLSSVAIVAGDAVDITSLTITQPAS